MSKELAEQILERYKQKNPKLVELAESVRYSTLVAVGEEQPVFEPPTDLIVFEAHIRKCLTNGVVPAELFRVLTQVVFNP
jgi:hypothetical protein